MATSVRQQKLWAGGTGLLSCEVKCNGQMDKEHLLTSLLGHICGPQVSAGAVEGKEHSQKDLGRIPAYPGSTF